MLLEAKFDFGSPRNAIPENPSSPCTKRCGLCELESEIAHNLRNLPEITRASSGVRTFL